jgi:hypothetical protein
MNRSQRNAANRIVRFYRERNAFTKVTSTRVHLTTTEYGSIWIKVETRRSDCQKYSPRAVLTQQTAFIEIRSRGAIRVHSADSCLRDERKHVAFMLRGTAVKNFAN